MKVIKHFAKRGVAVLIALALCVGMLNLTVFAASSNSDEQCPYGEKSTAFNHDYYEGIVDFGDGTHGKECRKCGYKSPHNNYPHVPDENAWTEKPATCTTGGQKTTTCLSCGATVTEDTSNALGHKWGSWTSISDAQHKHVCENDSNHTETAAHTWDEGKVTTEPTCETEGVKTYTCKECGATKTEPISATDHKWSNEWSKDENQHWHACIKGDAKNDVAGHTYGEWAVRTPATTETPGVEYHTCGACGHEETRGIEKLTPEPEPECGCGCIYDDFPDPEFACKDCTEENPCEDPDCQYGEQDKKCLEHVDGNGDGECDNCGQKIPCTSAKCGHSYGQCKNNCDCDKSCSCKTCEHNDADMKFETVEPTCEAAGYTISKCEVCGYTEKTETIPATGHDYPDTWTNDGDGHHSHKCNNNENHVEREAHEWAAEWSKDGTQHWQECTKCDATTEHEDHKFDGGWMVDEKTGEHFRVCSYCSLVDSHEADFGAWTEVESEHSHKCKHCTVTESHRPNFPDVWTSVDLLLESRKCEDCTVTETRNKEINRGDVPLPHGHEWDEGEVTKIPTCEDDGEMTYKCTVKGCSVSKNERIEAIGHDYPETWTNNGANHIRVCAHDASHVETADHSWSGWTAAGANTLVRTCSACGATQSQTINTPNPTPNPGPGTGGNGGNGGGTGGTGGAGETEIPEEEPPLSDEPEVEIPEEDPPLNDEPEVEVPEEDPPLSDEPEVEIPEEDPPLADVPETGDNSGIWMVTSAMSAAGLIVLVLAGKRKDEEA